MKIYCAFLAALWMLAASSPLAAESLQTDEISIKKSTETRSGNLDVVLLIDKSLSMADFFPKVQDYITRTVIQPILVPGDRIIINLVYGKTVQLLFATIRSQADKDEIIKQIKTIKPDGRFTDLGNALDVAGKDLQELGMPERPKYVLLVSDERQEAPKGSQYQAINYQVKHPYLRYTLRKDYGKFRAITVGIDVAAKIESGTPQLMELLTNPPDQRHDISAQSADSANGGSNNSQIEGNTGGTTAQSADSTYSSGTVGATGGNQPETKVAFVKNQNPAWFIYVYIGIAAAIVILVIALIVASKRRRKRVQEIKDDHR